MAKERISFSKQNLELSEIVEYYLDSEAALKKYYPITGKTDTLIEKFILYTKDEIIKEFKKRVDELDKTSSLTILTSVEAKFRIDYLNRCYKRKKDPLSLELRDLYKIKENHASLEDEILVFWKKHFPDYKGLFSEIIGALKYRHWIAHGRYWYPKLGRKFDYTYIYSLAVQLTSLPFED